MNEVPHAVLKMMTEYIKVRDCLNFEEAIHLKLNKKKYYVKRFEMEPIENTFRFFKKGQLRTYKIYSYVKDGITTWIHNWKKKGWKTANKKPVKNKDLWVQLDELVSIHSIDWEWVRGHTGHPQNEAADQLANQGIDALYN